MHDAEHEHGFDKAETSNKQILCQKKEEYVCSPTVTADPKLLFRVSLL